MDELLEAHYRQITELKTPREFSNMGTSKMFDLGLERQYNRVIESMKSGTRLPKFNS